MNTGVLPGAAIGALAVVLPLSSMPPASVSRPVTGIGSDDGRAIHVMAPKPAGGSERQIDECDEVVSGGGAGTLLYPFVDASEWTLSMPDWDRNDDLSSGPIDLPFEFRFRDRTYTSCFINTNGNVTFSEDEDAYTPDCFGGCAWMIAPFWADVDTRCINSGLVWHRFLDSDGDGRLDTFVVTWAMVGYFPARADKVNTFQLVMTDGSNPGFERCHNVAFSYGDMCWTTGAASGGEDGFGGVPAVVGIDWKDETGASAGNPLGRFDAPGGGSGGIDRLDGATFRLAAAPDPYDLDVSGVIDYGDIAIVLLDFGPGGGAADIDRSGVVDFGDVALLLLNYGPACQ